MVAMLTAMARWKGIMLDAYAMADLAYEVEREDLKIDGGYQDQYAATFGGFNFIEFHGRNNVVVNPLRIKKDIIHAILERYMFLQISLKTRCRTMKRKMLLKLCAR